MSKRFRRSVDQYENHVFSLACYLLRDRAEAQDVAQETFIKYWHRLDQIRSEQEKAWLMKVTRNACLDRLRRRKSEVEIHESTLTTENGPQSALQQGELATWISRAIDNLREPYRSLVVLRDVQQLSYNEVAQTLELSLEQVKVYLHRARKTLRQRLQEVNA